MKKVFLAFMAMAAFVFVGCNQKQNQETEETKVPAALTVHYGDTILVAKLMPGYSSYDITLDDYTHGIIEGDTVYVQCIGKTVMHIVGDGKTSQDVALTVNPWLTEDVMFKIPAFNWTLTPEQLIKEKGQPNVDQTVVEYGFRNIAYLLDNDMTGNRVVYYFSGDNYNNLDMMTYSYFDTDHGEMLKLFIAERFPLKDRGQFANGTKAWIYYDNINLKNATTQIVYYKEETSLQGTSWNVSFYPYKYEEPKN